MLSVFAGIYINRPLVDPDLWWHIAIGRWIVHNRWVPYVDYWNAFGAGKPWVAYSWSQEVLFAVIDSYFGLRGLLVLQTVLFAGISFALCYVYSRIAKDWLMGLLLGFVVTCSLGGFVLLRPQSFVWIYFLLLLYVLTDIIRKEDGEPLTVYHGFLLIAVMSLWANSHITTVLGLGLCFAWPLHRISISKHIFVVLLAFTGTLLTPYGGAEWLIFFSKTDHPFAHGSIVEFGPATIRDYGTGIYIFLLALLITLASRRPTLVYAGQIAAVVILGVGGMGVVKFLPFAIIIAGALIAEYWGDSPEGYGEISLAIEKFKSSVRLLEGKGLLFLVSILIILFVERPFKQIIEKDYVPSGALDFIKEMNLPYPILNAFGEGGYVMYRLSDQHGNLANRVSIDGRTNVNPVKIADLQGLAYGGRIGWQDYIDQARAKTIIWKNPSPLTALLVADSNWCRVYCDGSNELGYSVFVKREFFDSKSAEFWSNKYCADVQTTCFRDSDMYANNNVYTY
jgi:hypothetical protein